MTELREEFELRARLAAEERRRIDLNDQQRELTGLEAGRMPRFLTAQMREARGDKSRGSDKSGDGLSRLQQLLMNDPAYAALYEDTFDKLRAAEAAAERALNLALEARARARQALEDTLERAATLPDGTRVFRDENGEVWTEHDTKVDPEIAAGIQWRGDEPAREIFTARREAFEKSDDTVEKIRSVQVETLGRFRNELEDEANPLSEQRLEELGGDLGEIQQTMEERILEAKKYEANTEMPEHSRDSVSLDIPKL